jgi:hypothetical protein
MSISPIERSVRGVGGGESSSSSASPPAAETPLGVFARATSERNEKRPREA